MALLKELSDQPIPLSIQLAALDSLLEVCPMDDPSSAAPIVGVARVWLNAQMKHPWGHVLSRELKSKYPL
jgi:hypothetical protein